MDIVPRDIIRRDGELYIVEQIVSDHRGVQVLVKELDGDGRWVFGEEKLERVARRKVD
jgi:hypothetical protein